MKIPAPVLQTEAGTCSTEQVYRAATFYPYTDAIATNNGLHSRQVKVKRKSPPRDSLRDGDRRSEGFPAATFYRIRHRSSKLL
jgi:hypothetical protein